MPSPSSCVLFGARCSCFWQPFWPRQKSDHFAVPVCTVLVWARVAPFSLSCGGGGPLSCGCGVCVCVSLCLVVGVCCPLPLLVFSLGPDVLAFGRRFGQNRRVITSPCYFALFWSGQGWPPFSLSCGEGGPPLVSLSCGCGVVCVSLCLVVGVCCPLPLLVFSLGPDVLAFGRRSGQDRKVINPLCYFALFWSWQGWPPVLW